MTTVSGSHRPTQTHTGLSAPDAPTAWVYTLWFVIGEHVYCKVGYTTRPAQRLKQIASGFPEKPYSMRLFSCLDVDQARLIEYLLHKSLAPFRRHGEWFAAIGAHKLRYALRSKAKEIEMLLKSCGHAFEQDVWPLDGPKPDPADSIPRLPPKPNLRRRSLRVL